MTGQIQPGPTLLPGDARYDSLAKEFASPEFAAMIEGTLPKDHLFAHIHAFANLLPMMSEEQRPGYSCRSIWWHRRRPLTASVCAKFTAAAIGVAEKTAGKGYGRAPPSRAPVTPCSNAGWNGENQPTPPWPERRSCRLTSPDDH
jgi:hypothetical protein